MSKIQFTFSTLPHYFRKHGWLDPKPDGSHMKMITFLWWMFDRCSAESKTTFHDHRQVSLGPYEFIFGREKCYQETGLTEDEVRTRLKWLLKSKIVEKSPNSIPNRFTIYRVMTETFCESLPQLETQPIPNRSPTDPHKEEEKNKKNKKKESKVAAAPASALVFYEKDVAFSEDEYSKLQSNFTEQQLLWMIKKLQFWIETTDKKVKKDCSRYAYFKEGSWLVGELKKHEAQQVKTIPFQAFASQANTASFTELSDDKVDAAVLANIQQNYNQ